ncbi:MAG: hypothetical protein KDB01_14600 [Planctomycetaceae bacterium]|nr:hypothetical protein [Planctomycetaceae bacterium]
MQYLPGMVVTMTLVGLFVVLGCIDQSTGLPQAQQLGSGGGRMLAESGSRVSGSSERYQAPGWGGGSVERSPWKSGSVERTPWGGNAFGRGGSAERGPWRTPAVQFNQGGSVERKPDRFRFRSPFSSTPEAGSVVRPFSSNFSRPEAGSLLR